MIVYNLICEHQHLFEGWFTSAEDYDRQIAQKLLTCPVCSSQQISKQLSAPRLNLAQSETIQESAQQLVQAEMLRLMRQWVDKTEDVGERFAEEARRIHYQEAPERGIRGVASREEARALLEEGIEVMPLPIAEMAKQKLQ
ncbi:MAG: DUF1178 family protein [Burkholderiales bacterium]|jgi:hypothetical protein|nr:DUF1178 family protein [Burkholderiales bacterium]MCA3154305.1 DUF1178 family protein [Burkholderiales bacterium]MCA3157730.1 DUF1178 family protein [Burkholderiales bacterium]MCA3168628.1 DUF1178 family protein [Burkholderiales bacterium]